MKNALDTDQTLLTSVINYHVVAGLPEFTDNALLTTLGGASARVNVYTTPSVRSRTSGVAMTSGNNDNECVRACVRVGARVSVCELKLAGSFFMKEVLFVYWNHW